LTEKQRFFVFYQSQAP